MMFISQSALQLQSCRIGASPGFMTIVSQAGRLLIQTSPEADLEHSILLLDGKTLPSLEFDLSSGSHILSYELKNEKDQILESAEIFLEENREVSKEMVFHFDPEANPELWSSDSLLSLPEERPKPDGKEKVFSLSSQPKSTLVQEKVFSSQSGQDLSSLTRGVSNSFKEPDPADSEIVPALKKPVPFQPGTQNPKEEPAESRVPPLKDGSKDLEPGTDGEPLISQPAGPVFHTLPAQKKIQKSSVKAAGLPYVSVRPDSSSLLFAFEPSFSEEEKPDVCGEQDFSEDSLQEQKGQRPDHSANAAAPAQKTAADSLIIEDSDISLTGSSLFQTSLKERPAVSLSQQVFSEPSPKNQPILETRKEHPAGLSGPSQPLAAASKTMESQTAVLKKSRDSRMKATLRSGWREFESGSRMYVQNPDSLNIQVTNGTLKELKVRSQNTERIYPDFASALKTENTSVFSVEAQMESEDHLLHKASWTVVPVGETLHQKLSLPAGHIENFYALDESGHLQLYQQNHPAEPVLCRGFDPVQADKTVFGEILRLYVDNTPGVYSVSVNGKKTAGSLKKDELGQPYLPVRMGLGKTEVRLFKDGRTLWTHTLYPHHPFFGLWLSSTGLGCLAGILLDFRRRRLI